MHHFHDPSSRGGSPRAGLWAGCDLRVRWIVALAAVVAVVMSTRIGFGLLAFGGCLIAAAIARIQPKILARRLLGPLALAAVVCLVRTFMTGTTPMGVVDLGAWRLTATWEGFWAGALIASRVLGSLGIVMVVCHGTLPHEILAVLRWARVPGAWIEIALLMYRYLHILREQAGSVVAAQKVRLGYASLRRSLSSMGILAGIVMLRSLDQAEKSHEAMVARCYQGSIPLPMLPPLARRQWAAAFAAVAVVAATFFLAEGSLL